MWDKVRLVLYEICEIVEIIMAGAVVCGLVVAVTALWPELVHYWDLRTEAGTFLEFLDAVFNVVIGIEFMKMLCKPSSTNIIETLIFLIARHMIVEKTTPYDDLLSVISIGILFLFRRFMLMTKPDKNRNVPRLFQAMKIAQSDAFREAMVKMEEEDPKE